MRSLPGLVSRPSAWMRCRRWPRRCLRSLPMTARAAGLLTPPLRSPSTGGPPKPKRNGRLATDAPCRIRPAQAADTAAVLAVEQLSFGDPWPEAEFDGAVAGRLPSLVVRTDGH